MVVAIIKTLFSLSKNLQKMSIEHCIRARNMPVLAGCFAQGDSSILTQNYGKQIII